MIAYFFYVSSLILYIISLIFFVRINKRICSGMESKASIRKYESLFSMFFYSFMLINIVSYCFILRQNNYANSFMSYGASGFFAIIVVTIEAGFIVTKYNYDRYGNGDPIDPSHPKRFRYEKYSIYFTITGTGGMVFSFIPSFVIFGIIRSTTDVTTVTDIPLIILISLISIYQIALSIYRIFKKKKRDVSYLSFAFSVVLLFVSCFAYCLLLDKYFLPIAGVAGPTTVSGFTFVLLMVPNFLVSRKVEKTDFAGKKKLYFKDCFNILEVTNIVQGIVLPLASTLLYFLNRFNLIKA